MAGGEEVAGVVGGFRYRVSDALDVPLRGYLLRLRLLEGRPEPGAVRPGALLRLRSPGGEERVVRVTGFSTTGGRPTREALERKGLVDVVIPQADAYRGGRPVEIGWLAEGPVEAEVGAGGGAG